MKSQKTRVGSQMQTVSLYSIHGFLHRVIKRGGEA